MAGHTLLVLMAGARVESTVGSEEEQQLGSSGSCPDSCHAMLYGIQLLGQRQEWPWGGLHGRI